MQYALVYLDLITFVVDFFRSDTITWKTPSISTVSVVNVMTLRGG